LNGSCQENHRQRRPPNTMRQKLVQIVDRVKGRFVKKEDDREPKWHISVVVDTHFTPSFYKKNLAIMLYKDHRELISTFPCNGGDCPSCTLANISTLLRCSRAGRITGGSL
jgi:hypothetical protein